ncbi:MAG: sulfatase-like hydrolase/transferase [Opitutaceae bacterium]|nr:sulfatase-like hydrolase/transferase [Opitutaceae bacterium]
MKTPRHLTLAAAAFVFATVVPPMHAAAMERPNFVFIMADDLGWADVAFNGGNAPTPHLDRLAREGVRLTQHYSAPVCSPTRAALMTGRCWSRFGVTNPQNNRALPWDTVTLPRALKSLGYATCLTGKWHLGSRPEEGPNKFGFDHSYGSLAGGVGPWDHRYKEGEFSHTWHRNGQLLGEKGHVTDLIAQEAIAWLGRQNGNTPFFLYVPFTAVHLPVKEPAEWVQRVPAGITAEIARQYAASIMHLDDAVGRIVAALEQNGQRERTLLVFTSDNGGSWAENETQPYPKDNYPTGRLTGNNRPLRGQKGNLYEGGIRVPTVVSWPGVLPAAAATAPCQITDWMPTLCGIAGYNPDKNLKWDGTNIWPGITGRGAVAARTLYWAGPGFQARALREGDWKLIVSGKPSQEKFELFDLGRDPNEKQDLAVQMPGRVTAMKARLAEVARADRDAEVRE